MKRFQECNWVVKIWRYRWYLPIPFKWVWYMYIKYLVVRESDYDEDKECVVDTGNIYNPKGKELFRLLKSEAQIKMNWTYTFKNLGDILNHIKNKEK
jgi:hypothetical protein